MELSIVIPALNESHKIARDVTAAGEFLVAQGMAGEVIVVDDGSSDDTAREAEAAPLAKGVERQVIRLDKNRGKGAAVRAGIIRSSGDYVLFSDCGLCIPFAEALRGLEMLGRGECDMAYASRKLPASVIVRPQALRRRFFSRMFRIISRAMMDLPPGLSDTQCGFKLYTGSVARTLYAQSLTEGFLFDIEIIVRAQRLGYRVAEFPVTWTCDRDSRLRAASTTLRTIRELRAIRRMRLEPAPAPADAR